MTSTADAPHGRWPDDLLDVAALRSAGQQALPFREFVLKVHSRCNLACTYCYVYEAADQLWRTQPHTMSRRTAEQVCHRIGEHAERHRPASLRVILHGGEPLLAGLPLLRHLTRTLRRSLPAATRAEVVIQSNGILLDDDVLRLCHDEGITVAVSLDGVPEVHDKARRDHAGRGSHARVAAALRRLAAPEHRALWAGILCTVDVTADPVAAYEHLLSYDPPALRLLLPLGNWTHRPPERTADPARTPYGDWLGAVFDRWYREPRPPVRIAFFESVLDLLLGGVTRTETIGGAPSQLAVVDTDGSLTLSDQLKSAYEGADRSGLDVHHHSFDALLDHPGVVARQSAARGLAAQCRACPVVAVCGGGHYPHRYRAGHGYLNPSVYCPDLMALIRHVADTVRADLARAAEARP
ncbi:FxsB family cyclophane-forming radical SAM/SPASM peptide maturase [Streptomyces sp. HUAS TT20]|uniref:FxsB family cyclophane-forming radical SAM/SPASM peptide maturase n=1 Tax=Streptomyces sp. HUAS TT20 TaxID=3447509 RepID=UPI0021DA5086|nr:FxsB family cyclophane-forming radical SAM/SPASM peptide maturase [Streptomyces sp. HUAS 15-9]UXY31368.1 FxsB family radical SAM/SPASM domain protein [Streptomyces sp. HUAS 15-9]